MQTNKITIDRNGRGREEILEEASKYAVYNDLDKKTAFHIRLLAEEVMGMIAAISEDFDADIWLETTPERICQLHLTVHTDMDYNKRKQLMEVSSSGKNISVSGFMAKVGEFIRNSLFKIDEIAYRNFPKETADKAIRYIRESSRLLEMLDLIISEAIDAVT